MMHGMPALGATDEYFDALDEALCTVARGAQPFLYEYAPEKVPPPVLANIVSCVNFGVTIDLRRIAAQLPEVKYDPTNFAALIARAGPPKSCALIFSSSKCVMNGIRTPNQVDVACEKYAQLLIDTGHRVTTYEHRTQNAVLRAHIAGEIDVKALHENNRGHVQAKDKFSGVTYTLTDPSVRVVVFRTGCFNILGITSKSEGMRAFNKMVAILRPYVLNGGGGGGKATAAAAAPPKVAASSDHAVSARRKRAPDSGPSSSPCDVERPPARKAAKYSRESLLKISRSVLGGSSSAEIEQRDRSLQDAMFETGLLWPDERADAEASCGPDGGACHAEQPLTPTVGFSLVNAACRAAEPVTASDAAGPELRGALGDDGDDATLANSAAVRAARALRPPQATVAHTERSFAAGAAAEAAVAAAESSHGVASDAVESTPACEPVAPATRRTNTLFGAKKSRPSVAAPPSSFERALLDVVHTGAATAATSLSPPRTTRLVVGGGDAATAAAAARARLHGTNLANYDDDDDDMLASSLQRKYRVVIV